MEFPTETLPTSVTANMSDLGRERMDWDTIVISSVYALVCCVGVLGNALVIYVILRHTKMKTPTNIYILNLAVADELFMASMPFLAISAALQHWPFGPSACRLVLSMDGMNMFTSVFCLTVLSVDRYLAVAHPIRSASYRRLPVAKVVNLLVWVLSLLVITPIIVFADTQRTESGAVICNLIWTRRWWSKIFVVYTFLLGFLIPVTAIGLCYFLIVVKMREVALKAGWVQRRRSERRITWMVMLVVVVFAVCWTPFYTVQLVNVFWFPPDPTLGQLVIVLSYANSGANPILYAFVSDNFRQSFQKILCVRCLGAGPEEQAGECVMALNPKAGEEEAESQERRASGAVYPNGTCTSRTTAL
ncbi:somatostatin receptor type 1-like [Amblyraja radiata]|uniref:somatostatin receptor type 1-like n=1 Tax=Amblyraja radiata TaxID=386614 RepID=UPI00140279D5|nr:somatostatin receptor type 1-like [Amblyraja radiata]